MKKSRKAKLYFILSIFCLVTLFVICFVLPLPNSTEFNLLRFSLVINGLVLFRFYQIQNKYDEESYAEKQMIPKLQKQYTKINSIVSDVSKSIYESLPASFTQKYDLYIDDSNYYLLNFQKNINIFLENSGEKVITNYYIYVASLMDALVSSWKIKSPIPKEIAYMNELSKANCKLAVSVALKLCDISYETVKENPFLESLIAILEYDYVDNECGKLITIAQETLILEMLINNIFIKD